MHIYDLVNHYYNYIFVCVCIVKHYQILLGIKLVARSLTYKIVVDTVTKTWSGSFCI